MNNGGERGGERGSPPLRVEAWGRPTVCSVLQRLVYYSLKYRALSERSCNPPCIENDGPRLEFPDVRKEEGLRMIPTMPGNTLKISTPR